MENMNCLVTGGAGFIGSHLVDRLLNDGHTVKVIDNFSTGRKENVAHLEDNPNFKLVKADLANLKNILPEFQGQDIVFHLASLADIVPSIVDPTTYYFSNVVGTMSTIEAARQSNVKKLVYAASSSCYGIADENEPTRESAKIDPQYPYALTKYLGEETVFHWGMVYDLPVISLRLFNVYGPRSRTSGTYGAVFGVFLAQKLASEPFTVVGDGSQKRDFVYVSDVADAFAMAGYSNIHNEVFNVGTGNPQSVNRLIELLEGEKVFIPKRPGEPDCTWADITKIINMIGWEPKVSFEEGVAKIVENIDYWKDAPIWTPDTIEEATKDWFKYLVKK